jgi:hypothetical protein
MKNIVKKLFFLTLLFLVAFWSVSCKSDSDGTEPPGSAEKQNSGTETNTREKESASSMEPLEIDLPKPMFIGTPQNIRVANLEKPSDTPRAAFMAPKGTDNVAFGKMVMASDEQPIIGEIEMITDGDKSGEDGSYVEMAPFLQYVTIDLEAEYEIYAAVVWHFHKQARVYKDVIVQLCNEPDFIIDVQTIFNNDHDNSVGLGVGEDLHYVETYEGKLINAKGKKARYIRLYSNGNTSNDLNHYIEVEVYGRIVK